MTNKIEKVTLDTTTTLTNFLMALDAADAAETARFYNTENAIQLLKPLRAQYATLQDGRSKGKNPAAGELPAVIYINVIESIYNKKKTIADEQNQEFNLNYDNYRDYQVKQLKYYIETGDLLNNKKSTLQERALVAIDKLEKKAAAEAKAAEAAKAKAAKAAADKAKAEAKAAEAKAAADKLAEAAEAAADNINTKDEAEVFLDIVEQSEAAADDAEAKAVEAKAKAEAEAKAAKAEAEAEAKAKAAADKLAEAKAKAEALARGKTEPKPDLSSIEFSKDCRAEMTDVLNQLSNDYSEVELLCLASLIRKRYTPSKA